MTGSSSLRKVSVTNGSGWYLKKGRSTLIEISLQSYKFQFVELIFSKYSTKSTGIQPHFGAFTKVASRAFVPTNAQNRLPAWPPKICFCLLGQCPKPFEQPRGRGWLRVRFTNAVLPCKVKTGRSRAHQRFEKRQLPICPAKKKRSGHSPAMKLCASAGPLWLDARLPQAVPPPTCRWW